MLRKRSRNDELERYQDDWAARVEHNGKVSGVSPTITITGRATSAEPPTKNP